MRINAIPDKARNIKPGDLFSTAGPVYWRLMDNKPSIGEKVYIRTNTPADAADDADEEVYKIEIIKEGL